MLPHYFVKRKSSRCCLKDSRPHTQHINQILSEPSTYYLVITVITSVNWTLQTRQ